MPADFDDEYTIDDKSYKVQINIKQITDYMLVNYLKIQMLTIVSIWTIIYHV